ncbi:MAG: hypothetical protein HOM19_00295, partial [Candidatus Marinimicrobia bacterium]|nr:hypothetical protein [Candidatus Neomarinimicrobiota bacterium]
AQVGVGTSSPNAAAALDVVSTSKGLVPPRMTAAQRNSISNPPAGLMLWCSDCGTDGQLQVYNGSEYTNIIGGSRLLTNVHSQIGGDIDGEATYDYSGWSASLSSDGTIVAIGAIQNAGNGSNAGHVRVYQYASSTWSQLGSDIDGEAASDNSGYSVSLSSDGTIVAIGAIYNDGYGSNSGHVRVYQYASSNWSQLGSDIDGEAAGDQSGVALSLSSDGVTLAIGARWNDGNGSSSGHVRVYQYASDWSQLGSDIDGETSSNWSGCSVSLSGDGTTVAIGSTHNDNNTYTDAGHVRVYQYASSAWSQLGSDIDGLSNWESAGFSVALSDDGTIVAVGATDSDGGGVNSGGVRVYQYASSTWSPLGNDIDGEAASDKEGYSVSLSSDGTIVAIGAIHNDGNGSNSGHVRVYQYASSTWSQLGSDIDGEAAGDKSGYSVSLSSDGTIVSIGTPYNGGNGSNSGHVRVYAIQL